jgi:hypothetical protein
MVIPLRPDFDALSLRAIAKKAKNGAQARRLLALATIYESGSRTQAVCIGSVTLRIVRDWVVKSNAALMGLPTTGQGKTCGAVTPRASGCRSA